jgi:antitoxin CcdA
MGYDRTAPKRPVNLNLDSDLIDQCRSSVAKFSAYVEALLTADLAQRQARAQSEKARTERAIEAFSALYSEHGSSRPCLSSRGAAIF